MPASSDESYWPYMGEGIQASPSSGGAQLGSGKMKVAVVTDDLVTVSPHFGMAKHYLVYQIEDGAVKWKETRDKMGHGPGGHEHHHGESGPEMAVTHNSMLSNVSDCDVLIARGMGTPMYASIVSAGKRAFITRIQVADEAVNALLAGNLDNHLELLH